MGLANDAAPASEAAPASGAALASEATTPTIKHEMEVTEEGSAAREKSPAVPTEEEKVIDMLQSMGFPDRGLIKIVINKMGLDVEACAHELVSLSEWDAMLSDLEEMGFNNRERNKELLVENSGSIKKTVKTLVADGSA